jgi:hypothetical protein
MPDHDVSVKLFEVLGFIGIVLQLLLVVLLLRGSFRKYPLVLAYCVIQLILTAAEYYFIRSTLYRRIYWTDEIVLNLLLFLMVISFTYRALGDSPLRVTMGKLLAGVFVIVLLLPFLVFKGPPFKANSWFNHTSQLLSFGAAILNLGLWSALVSNRRRDRQLLSVSAGLGVAVTGAAISYGVRAYLTGGWLLLPDLFMSTTFVVCMVIWCWAFRPRQSPLASP